MIRLVFCLIIAFLLSTPKINAQPVAYDDFVCIKILSASGKIVRGLEVWLLDSLSNPVHRAYGRPVAFKMTSPYSYTRWNIKTLDSLTKDCYFSQFGSSNKREWMNNKIRIWDQDGEANGGEFIPQIIDIKSIPETQRKFRHITVTLKEKKHTQIKSSNPGVIDIKGDTSIISWQKVYGGNGIDGFSALKHTYDGNLLVAGTSGSGNIFELGIKKDLYECWVMKLDSLGTKIWSNFTGGFGYDEAEVIHEVPGDSYLISGSTDSHDEYIRSHRGSMNMLAYQLDKNGKQVWCNTYRTEAYETNRALLNTPDGGLLLAGYSQKIDSGTHYFLVKTDEQGKMKWRKEYAYKARNSKMSLVHAVEMGLSGYLLAGNEMTGKYNMQGSLLRIDSIGNIIWKKNLNGIISSCIAHNNGYVVCGSMPEDKRDIPDKNWNNDLWIAKLDAGGEVIWEKTFGGSGDDYGTAVVSPWNGNRGGEDFTIVGSSNSSDGDPGKGFGKFDAWILKINKNGEKMWWERFGGKGDDLLNDIVHYEGETYIATGYTDSYQGEGQAQQNGWILKFKKKDPPQPVELLISVNVRENISVQPPAVLLGNKKIVQQENGYYRDTIRYPSEKEISLKVTHPNFYTFTTKLDSLIKNRLKEDPYLEVINYSIELRRFDDSVYFINNLEQYYTANPKEIMLIGECDTLRISKIADSLGLVITLKYKYCSFEMKFPNLKCKTDAYIFRKKTGALFSRYSSYELEALRSIFSDNHVIVGPVLREGNLRESYGILLNSLEIEFKEGVNSLMVKKILKDLHLKPIYESGALVHAEASRALGEGIIEIARKLKSKWEVKSVSNRPYYKICPG